MFLAAMLLVFISGCDGNKDEKKNETSITKRDSVVAEEELPSLEKEFYDTLVVKPVKDSVLLKFRFQKGRTYNYAMTFDVNQRKGDQSSTSTMKWNYDMQVVDENSEVKTVKTTYKRIEMTMEMGGQKMEFSSEKQVDAMDFMQMPSRMFSIIKGKSFTMQVNGKGEVVSVSGFDKIGEAVINEMNLPEQSKPMMRQNFQKQFNDDAAKQMFSQAFEIYPNKFVKVGDSWKSNSSLAVLKREVATVYTVKNIRGNRVFINGESKLKSSDGRNTGTQTSKLIIDSRTGLMIDGIFDQKSNEGGLNTRSRITGKEI